MHKKLPLQPSLWGFGLSLTNPRKGDFQNRQAVLFSWEYLVCLLLPFQPHTIYYNLKDGLQHMPLYGELHYMYANITNNLYLRWVDWVLLSFTLERSWRDYHLEIKPFDWIFKDFIIAQGSMLGIHSTSSGRLFCVTLAHPHFSLLR